MKKYVNGVLIDMTEEEIALREVEEAIEANRDKRPLLTGEMFVKHLRSLFNNLTLGQRATLLAPMVTIFSTIEGDTHFTEIEFAEGCEIVKSIAEQTKILSSEQIIAIYNSLIIWSKDYKFAQ